MTNSKNNNENWIIVAGLVAGFVILWLSYEKDKAYKLLEKSKSKNKDLENENEILLVTNKELIDVVHEFRAKIISLKLMVEGDKELESGVKKKINELIDTYKEIDLKVTNELTAAMALIEIKQPVKAAFSLAKIVENLLEEKYSSNVAFNEFVKENNNGKKKDPSFHDYIEFAKKEKLIETEEYHFAKGLKAIRNQEGHELDVKKHENWLLTAIFTGIGLIFKLSKSQN